MLPLLGAEWDKALVVHGDPDKTGGKVHELQKIPSGIYLKGLRKMEKFVKTPGSHTDHLRSGIL
jgi:hypothetical protein